MNPINSFSRAGPAQSRSQPEVESPTEATGIRVAVLTNYAGVLRRLRSGDFLVQVPSARDSALNQLGLEIGALATELEEKFDHLERISQISLDMSAGLVLEEVLERAYVSFRGLIPYDRIGCALIDQATWALRARWARTEAREVVIGKGYEQPLDGSSLEGIVRTGDPRILNDLPAYLVEHPLSDATRRIVREGMRSSLTCPLVAQGRPVGFLFFSSLKAGTYCAAHGEIFGKIAQQLSAVVERSLLYEKLFELNRQLTTKQLQLEYQATHDSMTGLPNRAAILEELSRTSARSARKRATYGVLMLDIDHFKQFNDRHGHLTGDAAIQHVGKLFAATVRAGECIGRYGGEEFLAVLEVPHATALAAVAERFRRAVADMPVNTSAGSLPVTVSIGGALGCQAGLASTEQVLANADNALYAAKAAGRNCAVIDMDTASEES